jgi:TolB-like protein/class 3 adenylate cyclase
LERRLTAILATDVVGYSRLMANDEAGTHERLTTLRTGFVEPAITDHNGRIVKLMGDGILVEFASVVDAVTCAIAIQDGIFERQKTVPADRRIQLRIGVNIGDVIIEDGDIYGDGVNVAARLESLAEPGGICVSRTVYEYTRGKVGHAVEHMGAHKVKNIPEPINVYRVVNHADSQATRRARAPVQWLTLGAGALALAAAALLLWLQPWQPAPQEPIGQTPPAAPSRPSLAVLPFDNLSTEADDEYFADGLTDDLITDLSKISGLLVIARNTVFTYKGRAVDIRDVARELGVRYVLEGSVRRAGDRIRVNAQLIDSQTGGHLWAERLDRDVSDIFAVQDEVIRHIVDSLAIQLSPSEMQRVERLPTNNLEAYDYYLRAEQAARISFSAELRAALSLYNKATALDPSFAEAYAAGAWTAAYVFRSNYDTVLPSPVARKRAYELSSRALELDSEAPLPFAVLAILQAIDGRFEQARISAERAVALGPSEAEAHSALSFVLTFSGHHADAVAAVETLMQLNPRLRPGDWIVPALAFILNDEPERAVDILEQARVEAPDIDDIHAVLSAAYALSGQAESARHAAAEAVRVSPNLNVAIYRAILAQFRNDRDLAKILDAMRSGGLPEWPYGYTPGSSARLTAAEIKALGFGRAWRGRTNAGVQAMMQITTDGGLAFRSPEQISIGRAFIVNDMLCEQAEGLSLGRPVCGPVYRVESSVGEGGLAYTYVNASKLFHFSPVE